MAQRLTRAKKKIRAAGIPFRIPGDGELPDRLAGVLATIYLVFNEGYLPGSGGQAGRTDLSGEAIRLCRVLRALLPDEPEVAGLLGLMLLTEARRPARIHHEKLVALAQQDRFLWDRQLIADGHALVRWCLQRDRPGPYQLMAAVSAVHADAREPADTDWRQILALYDRLLALNPTPVVALNRAIAVGELAGPQAALELVDGLDLDGYHAFHATRADLLRRLGRTDEAIVAYHRAIELAGNPAERAFLRDRRQSLRGA